MVEWISNNLFNHFCFVYTIMQLLYLAYNQGVFGTRHILEAIKNGTGITNADVQRNMNFNRHGVPWNAAPEVWLKGMEDWANF